MTYNVKVTMPDGNQPDLPPMDDQQLREYLAAIKATPDYMGVDDVVPESGQAVATYVSPGDTKVEWSPVAD